MSSVFNEGLEGLVLKDVNVRILFLFFQRLYVVLTQSGVNLLSNDKISIVSCFTCIIW